MIVIGTETVERYFATHEGARGIRAARSQYEVWLAIARRAQWRYPEDVKASHPRAIYTISVGGSFQAASETAFYQAMPNVQRFTLGAWPSQPAAWKAAAPGSLNGSVVIDTIDPENPRTKAVANMLSPYLPSSWTMSQYAADGYDALMLISEAIKKAGGTAEPALNAAFQTIQNFPTTFGQPSSTLSFSATKNSGSNGACSLVLKEFNANNTLTQDWGTFQPSC